MRLLLTAFVILLVLNLIGGYSIPAYGGWGYYRISWGGIILIILILYCLGVGRGNRM